MIAVLIEAAVRSSVLMLAAWLLIRALRVSNPRVERFGWLSVLAASIAMPFAMQAFRWPAALTPSAPWLPDASIGAMTISESTLGWSVILIATYVGVLTVLSLRQVVGLVRLWRIRSSAKVLADDLDDVRVSTAVTAPATIFSTILVPSDFAAWSASERDAVLTHERTHIAHKDFYVQVLAQFHRHIFWFNPLAWWLPRRLALLSEHISDDAAIESSSTPVAYAELLLAFAKKSMSSEQVIAMARPATLAVRIERILQGARDSTRTNKWKLIGVAAALIPLAAVAATFKTEKEPTRGSSGLNHEPPAQLEAEPQPATSIVSNVVLPRSNRARPLSHPIYPPASRRLGETGTVVLKLHVLEDGSVGDAIIEKSSGYPDLDYSAMYESFRWKLDPGTVDGQPQRMWGQFAVTFKLSK